MLLATFFRFVISSIHLFATKIEAFFYGLITFIFSHKSFLLFLSALYRMTEM